MGLEKYSHPHSYIPSAGNQYIHITKMYPFIHYAVLVTQHLYPATTFTISTHYKKSCEFDFGKWCTLYMWHFFSKSKVYA